MNGSGRKLEIALTSAAAVTSVALAVGAMAQIAGVLPADADKAGLDWGMLAGLAAVVASVLYAASKLSALQKAQRSSSVTWLTMLVAESEAPAEFVLELVHHESPLNKKEFRAWSDIDGPDSNIANTYKLLVRYDALGRQVRQHFVDVEDVRFLMRDFERVMKSPWVQSYLKWMDESVARDGPVQQKSESHPESNVDIPQFAAPKDDTRSCRSHDDARWLLEYFQGSDPDSPSIEKPQVISDSLDS